MSTYKLSNVHNGLNGYNQLIKLYETYKDDLFEDIKKGDG